MKQLTSEDLKRIMDLVSVPIKEERLKLIAPLLNQVLETISVLDEVDLPKEVEPWSYQHAIKNLHGD